MLMILRNSSSCALAHRWVEYTTPSQPAAAAILRIATTSISASYFSPSEPVRQVKAYRKAPHLNRVALRARG